MSDPDTTTADGTSALLGHFLCLGGSNAFALLSGAVDPDASGGGRRSLRQVTIDLMTGFVDLVDRPSAVCPFHATVGGCRRAAGTAPPDAPSAPGDGAAPWWRRRSAPADVAGPTTPCAMRDALQQGSHILLWHSPDGDDEAEILGLVAGLRRRGPNLLLWVRPADPAQEAGTVDYPMDGLLVGYLADAAGTDAIDREAWLALCGAALDAAQAVRNGSLAAAAPASGPGSHPPPTAPRHAVPPQSPPASGLVPHKPAPGAARRTPTLAEVATEAFLIEETTFRPLPPYADFEQRLSNRFRNPFYGWSPQGRLIANYRLPDIVLDGTFGCLANAQGSIDGTAFLTSDDVLRAYRVDKSLLVHCDEPGPVMIGCNRAHANYFHWVTQSLTAIDITLRRPGQDPRLKLALPPLNAWQQESLALLGHAGVPHVTIADRTRQYAIPNAEFAEFTCNDTAWSVSHRAGEVYARLRRSVAATPGSPEKLYVARTDSGRRRMLNEDVLISAMRARGYHVVIPSDLSFQEQIRLFRGASLVVGPHGAGLTNIVFCEPGTVVYELVPTHYRVACFTNLAAICGLRYWADVVGVEAESGVPGSARDWYIDPAQVLERVDEIESLLAHPSGGSGRTRRPVDAVAPDNAVVAGIEPIGLHRGPVFHTTPLGRLGNRMIEYMVALTFRDLVPDCAISNVSLPDWGIEHPALLSPGPVVTEQRQQHIDLPDLAEQMRRGEIRRIEWAGYGQRMENFRPVGTYRTVFTPPPHRRGSGYGPEYLVCPVRAEELLSGEVTHYPLTPVEFYRDIVAMTGLKPVFMGQTAPNAYTDRLRAAFPEAEFRPETGDPIADFQLIRESRNIVVGVSTFIWLAAWLSETADNIFMAVSGIFNPFQFPEVDLLPFDDKRYRFFLFPVNHGVPLDSHADAHRRLAPYWREVPHAVLRRLIEQAPRFAFSVEEGLAALDVAHYLATYRDVARATASAGPAYPREHYRDHGYAEGRPPVFVDAAWYVATYPLAAFEIGQGDYADALQHYVVTGRLRGYRPNPGPPQV